MPASEVMPKFKQGELHSGSKSGPKVTNPKQAVAIMYSEKRQGLNKGGSAHPGFKAVQSSIAQKSGVSEKAAGAILASKTRHASAAAKRANPNLKKVK